MTDLNSKPLFLHGFRHPRALSGYGEDAPVCVAFSGGADSTALLALLAGDPLVSAVHVHHGIRGAEADRDEAFCRDLAERLHVPLTVLRIDAPALAAARGVSLETAARDGRYEAILAHMRENHVPILATAHHANDQLETVLQHLLRGSGLGGLCGIPPCRMLDGTHAVVRPLLAVSREELRAFLQQNHLPYVEDSSNGEPCCTRNRLRLEVLPLLEDIFPGGVKSALRCTETLSQDEAYLGGLAAAFLEREGKEPRLAALSDLPRPIFARVMQRLLPCAPEKQHIDALYDFCERRVPHARISLPGVTLTAAHGRLCTAADTQVQDYEIRLQPGENPLPCGMAFLARKGEPCQYPHANLHKYATQISLGSATIKGELLLRNRREGDRLLHGGMHKAVRRLAGLSLLPPPVRARMPLVADGEGLAAVPLGRENGAPLYRDGTDPKHGGDLMLYLFFD